MISISSLSLPLVGMTTRFGLRWHRTHRKIRSKLAVGPLGRGAYPSLRQLYGRCLGVRRAVELVSATPEATGLDRTPGSAVSRPALRGMARDWHRAACSSSRYDEPVAAERSRPNPRHMTDPATDEFRPTLRT